MKLIFIIMAVFVIFIILALIVLLKNSNNTDLMTDVNNCGRVGNKCSDEQVCQNGKCECKYVCKFDLSGKDDRQICACSSGDKDNKYFCKVFTEDVENCGGCDIKCDTVNGENCVNGQCISTKKEKVKEGFYYTVESPYDFSNIWDLSSKEKLFIILKSKSALNDIQIKCVMDYVMTKHRPDIMNLGLGDILNIASGYFDPGSKWRACLDIK